MYRLQKFKMIKDVTATVTYAYVSDKLAVIGTSEEEILSTNL
jgi:hypothetical protein